MGDTEDTQPGKTEKQPAEYVGVSPRLTKLLEEAHHSPTVYKDRRSQLQEKLLGVDTEDVVDIHDEYCPKSRPTRTVINTETGDHWVFGPEKYLCFCNQLAAMRQVEGGADALRNAYQRGRFDATASNE